MLDCKNIRSCYDTLTQKIDMCCNKFISKKLLKHRMVPCNKDISIHLEGFEVPYIMDYLSRKILVKANTKFLFRESGRSSRSKAITEHFASKGTFLSEDSEDIHEYCALYKRWMRSLTEPLIPLSIQETLKRRILLLKDETVLSDCHLHGLAELLVGSGLTPSLVCLIHCIFFLQQIVHLHHENAMNPFALAGIFAVILFEIGPDPKLENFNVILQGLIGFLEYVFSGKANTVLEEALASSDLNKKKVPTNTSNNVAAVRNNSNATRSRPRLVNMANEPVLLEWRTNAFDSTSLDGSHPHS